MAERDDPTEDEAIPDETIAAAERLTRLAREAVDDAEREAYRSERDALLSEHDFTARVRASDDTLVLHPAEWLDDGVARVERIEDVDRAIEVPLSGPDDPEGWEAAESHNAELVAAVADECGEIHAANARAFADFMGNHYARRVETATAAEIREFLDEYFPRNAWPSADQRAVVDESIELLFEAADESPPEFTAARR